LTLTTMSFMRTRAARSLQQGLRAGAARPVVQSRTQFAARRYASSGGHGEQGSDLPWLISALAITPAGAYFLWPSPSGDAHHGHEEHHEEHHEEAEAKEEEQPQEEESKDEQPKDEEAKDEQPKEGRPQEEGKDVPEKTESQKTEQPSGTEGESQPRADGNKKSSGKEEAEERAPTSGPASTEGISGKGQMKNDSEGHNQSSKREPDGKGGFKNRKDSGLQKDLTPSPEDSEANSGDISKKQGGMSNTQTRHSIPIHESDEKSKKPEGGPDTAKAQGTIDPNRPQK